jgi:VIT1/CCC1 family predicted Fe2+/Mn2+ transporter
VPLTILQAIFIIRIIPDKSEDRPAYALRVNREVVAIMAPFIKPNDNPSKIMQIIAAIIPLLLYFLLYQNPSAAVSVLAVYMLAVSFMP